MTNAIEKIIEPVTANVSSQRIARVYAEALYDAAEAKGQAQDVFDELTALIDDVFRQDAALEMYFSSGVVSRDHKKGLIDKTFAGRSSETLTNFLLVLNQHDRLDLLRPIQQVQGIVSGA